MQPASAPERRSRPRFNSDELSAQVRVKGQLGRLSVEVIDFNRHGLAVRIERPLPKDQLVFISLDAGHTALPRVIGIIHNCLAQPGGYRCGIRFRTQSGLQFDRAQVEAQLARLEVRLSGEQSLATAD